MATKKTTRAKKVKATAHEPEGEVVEKLPEGKVDAKAEKTPAKFRDALNTHAADFVPLLPQHVSKERFLAAAVEAVRQNPDLLGCSPRTLFGALAKAAQDGLMPDGREGVITPYKGAAQWNPMAFGFRKRARELDDIIVDADIVCAKDTFEHIGGDTPMLRHMRPPLGTERGGIVGCYAIFRKGDHILHREVMDRSEVEATRKQSKAPDSLMWKNFTSEAYKKTVVRRGFKSVPCSERLEALVRREDELFSFDEVQPKQIASQAAIDAAVPALTDKTREATTKAKANAALAAADTPGTVAAKAKQAAKVMKGAAEALAPKGEATVASPSSVLSIRTRMFSASSKEALTKIWTEMVLPYDWAENDKEALSKTFEDRSRRLSA